MDKNTYYYEEDEGLEEQEIVDSAPIKLKEIPVAPVEDIPIQSVLTVPQNEIKSETFEITPSPTQSFEQVTGVRFGETLPPPVVLEPSTPAFVPPIVSQPQFTQPSVIYTGSIPKPNEVSYEDEKEPDPVTVEDPQPIRKYSEGGQIFYPHLMMTLKPGKAFQKANLKALNGALDPLAYVQDVAPEGVYLVYLSNGVKTLAMGVTHPNRLRIFLTKPICADYDKYIMLSENTKLEGDMMMSCCTLANL